LDTSSESWRAECEARHVLKLMDRGKGPAAEYLELVAKKRGQKAADELRQAVADMWRKK
jgi:hypothetical protein